MGGKINVDSVKKGYIRMANGLQYIIERYYFACGLTFLATHFWQMKDSISTLEAANNLRIAVLSLRYDAIAIAKLLIIDIAGSYTGDIEISSQAINVIERCDADGKMTSFLWMICEVYMGENSMMLSCVLGIKIMRNRRQSDDRGGLQYE
ncbi:8007_t:CDS:2, partial [Gigaspora rosea]